MIGLGLLLPLVSPAVTTQPSTSIPTVEQTAFAYDAGSMHVISDSVLTGFGTDARLASVIGQVTKLDAAKSDMTTVYRGVHAEHPQLPNALRGSAEPIGGHSNPLWHNQGDDASVFTSWTTDRSVAEWFASQRGPGGVVLEQSVPRSSLVTSPDLLGEFEVLRVGPINGATPTVLGQ